MKKTTNKSRITGIMAMLGALALVVGVLGFGRIAASAADEGGATGTKRLEVSTAEEMTAALADETVGVIVVSANITVDTATVNEKSSTAIFTADRTVTIESKAGNVYTIKRSAGDAVIAKSLFEIYGNGEYDGIQVSFKNIILDGGAVWQDGMTAEQRYEDYTDGGKCACNTGVKGRAIIDVANKATINLESGCVVQNGETTVNVQTRDGEPRGVAGGSSKYGGGIRIEYSEEHGGGTVNLKLGSVIQDVVSEAWGGAIGAYNYGRLNIYGGTIRRCASKQGAAIACTYRDDTDINTASVMKMYGGLVEDCWSPSQGVIVIECGPEALESEINGGTIRNCGNHAISAILNTTLKLASIDDGTLVLENIADEGNYTDGGYTAAHGIHKGADATIVSVNTCELTFVDGDVTLGSVIIEKGTSAGASFPGDRIKEGAVFTGWYDGDSRVNKDTIFNKNTTVIAKWHTHKWVYEIKTNEDQTAATITAYCEDSDETTACTYIDAEHGVSFVVNAPAISIAGEGTPSAITVDNAELSNFNLITGLSLSVGDAVYYTSDGTPTNTDPTLGGAASEGAVPETAGTYCAAITIGDETAYVWFRIAADEADLEGGIEIPEDLPWVKSAEFVSDIILSDGYLHFSNVADPVRMYGYVYDLKTKEKGAKVESTYLDLSNETLTTSLAYDCYSLDGGATWKAIKQALTSKDIGKWFSDKRTILIANNYDKNKKKPGDNATVYWLGKTLKRADAIALKPEYLICRDPYGVTNGQWSLKTSKGEIMALSRFEFRPIDEIGAKLCADVSSGTDNIRSKALANLAAAQAFTNNGIWATWPGKGGIWVPDLNESGKAQKAKYEYRVKATVKEDSSGNLVYTPASKVKKFTVSSILKPTKIKADYKKETLGTKAGMSVYFGASIPVNAVGEPEATALPAKAECTSFAAFEGKIKIGLTKEEAKGFNIAPYITENRNTVLVWQTATEKKPASKLQKIVLAARAQVEEKEVTPDEKGRITLDAKYEILNSKGKWVAAKNLTATEETIYKLRVKCTAKGSKETGTTIAEYGESAKGIEGSLIIKVNEGKVTGATMSRQTKEELEAKSE